MLNRRIDSTEPLPAGVADQMLMAAHAHLARTAPIAGRPQGRLARRFRRAPAANRRGTDLNVRTPVLAPTRPERLAGATRYTSARGSFRRYATRALNDSRRMSMPMAMLSASSMRGRAPKAEALDILKSRAQAMAVIGVLNERRRLNIADMNDGKGDMNRTARAQARFILPSALIISM